MDVRLLARPDELAAAVAALASADELPLDVESDGLHAYQPGLCVLQVAACRAGVTEQVLAIDTLALIRAGGDEALAPLRGLLGPDGPSKIIHDLAFDARILAQHGLPLGRVRDTAVAARFLGIAATGLASLLSSRLGHTIDKGLQHHDWRRRPIEPAHLAYLGADVAHLGALAASLFGEAAEKDIVPEVEDETAYRLAGALAAGPDLRPPWARIKGIGDLDAATLGALSVLADVREGAARDLDVPVHTVIGNDPLIAIARARTKEAVRKEAKGRGARIAGALIAALEAAPADVSPDDRARWVAPPPKMPRDVIERRKRADSRLRAFRKAAARERGVDEQVVLPGHCLSELVDLAPTTVEGLAGVPGLGARRIARDGVSLLAALTPADRG